MNDVCQCKGCERDAIYLGMCNRHYRRLQKYGSPFVTKLHALRGMPAERRFARLHKKMESGCWEWIGPVEKDGYGVFSATWNGTAYKRAHRFSWAFHNLSEIPEDMVVCHKCDNPRCVNPDHLWLGSTLENNSDRAKKGRNHVQSGERSNAAILTESQVRSILSDSRPYAEIAHAYGVAMTTISGIKNRVSWAHLEDVTIVKAKRGSGSGNRGKSDRITPEIVRHIRTTSDRGVDLAVQYKVSPQLIAAIRSKRLWAHVE